MMKKAVLNVGQNWIGFIFVIDVENAMNPIHDELHTEMS